MLCVVELPPNMALAPKTKTTFIGDDILMKYKNNFLRIPNMLHYCGLERVYKQHFGFTIAKQRLATVKTVIEQIVADYYRIKEKVVILLGTRDILLLDHGPATVQFMIANLNELIAWLQDRNVHEIILCTLPCIQNASALQKEALKDYNSFLKHLASASTQEDRKIRCVDLNARLLPDIMFESDTILPNDLGLQTMHDALKNFL